MIVRMKGQRVVLLTLINSVAVLSNRIAGSESLSKNEMGETGQARELAKKFQEYVLEPQARKSQKLSELLIDDDTLILW